MSFYVCQYNDRTRWSVVFLMDGPLTDTVPGLILLEEVYAVFITGLGLVFLLIDRLFCQISLKI